MISFASQDLFSSGPSRFHVGGRTLRYTTQADGGGAGVALAGQGYTGRRLTQTGQLTADTVAEMAGQLAAIEALVDGVGYPLVDDTDRTWDDVVMLRFEPGPITPLGPRVKVDFTIDYLQTTG